MTDQSQKGPLVAEPRRRVHDLKCQVPHWEAINDNRKRFEIRKNDRDYRIGDVLILREFEMVEDDSDRPVSNRHTGRVCQRTVTYVLPGGQFGLAEGFVALSLVEEPTPGGTPCVVCGYPRAVHGTGTAGVCHRFNDGSMG